MLYLDRGYLRSSHGMTTRSNGMTAREQRDDDEGLRYDGVGCEYSNNSKLRSQYQLVCQMIGPHFPMWVMHKCFI